MLNNKYLHLTFIGKDGSMGLKHGSKYKVELYTHCNQLVALIHINMFINITCTYDTLIGFSKNWEVSK